MISLRLKPLISLTAAAALMLVWWYPAGLSAQPNSLYHLTHKSRQEAHARSFALNGRSSTAVEFTENRGQWPDSVLFRAWANGALLWFTRDGVYYQYVRIPDTPRSTRSQGAIGVLPPPGLRDEFRTDSGRIEVTWIKAEFVGASGDVRVVGLEETNHRCSYFIGSDPSRWRTDVSNYCRVEYKGVYSGVDVVFSGRGARLDCQLVSDSETLLSQVKVEYRGAAKVESSGDGTSVLRTFLGDLSATGIVISGRSAPDAGDSAVSLRSSPLIAVNYSTYLGGNGADSGRGIAVDREGSAYVTGWTNSSDFPTSLPLDGSWNGSLDVFVSKLSSNGSSLVYSTYLGGTDDDYGLDIEVDSLGSAYLTGYTGSCDFPTVASFDNTCNSARDAFVAKLNPAGNSLEYSTYLGGSSEDWGRDIALDTGRSAYVIGYTSSGDFPIALPFDGSYNGANDVFVTKLSPSGSSLLYSTFLGGTSDDWGIGIAVDLFGNAYACGFTFSSAFPTVNAYDATYSGSWDAFVTKLNRTGQNLIYSTFLGSTGEDGCRGIAVDSAGCAYVTGFTNSPAYPTVTPFDAGLSGSFDAFVSKLGPTGNTMIYSTFLGGSAEEAGRRIALDREGNAYITGYTTSADFPTAASPDDSWSGGRDAFLTKLSGTGSTLEYSTYLGGSGDDFGNGVAVDDSSNAYVFGDTRSIDFPTTVLYQTAPAGNNVFVVIFGPMIDSDSDGIADWTDNCPAVPNPEQFDTDDDGTGDVCDGCTDSDGDGFGNPGFAANTCELDNCPFVANPTQGDTNSDGVGDACCCVDVTGNVNYVGIVDLADLSALVSYLTGGGYLLPCPNEANVNGTGIVDLGDLSALVSYLTGGGYMLPNCP